MNRMILSLVGLVTLTAAACDKSAAEAQESADKAQAKANAQITSAEVTANDKMNKAQAQADKTIGQAQADFEKTVEDYRHDAQANLTSLDKKLSDLDAKAVAATSATKANLTATSGTLHRQRDAFAADVASLDYTAATMWDATRARVDKEWTDLHAAVDRAM